ncbi:HAD-IA family hydrolase [Streptomyces cyaneofuscatus]|uniref:HAD-IA family hydrolase n=1 Tax=Streptomyces cyaneofuscatus TaxID=66883 RepID=UPI00364757A7
MTDTCVILDIGGVLEFTPRPGASGASAKTPNEELVAYLRGIRRRCRLGILSNSFVGARERETALYRFDELVDEIVYSHEIGINKPDPRAFEAACAALGVRPEDCLFVDDVLVNVEAARGLGMQAHLYEDNARTIARIAAHVEAGRALHG